MAKKKAKPRAKPKPRPKPKKKGKPKIDKLIPIVKGQQCTARVKICSNKDCKHRYEKGDKSWACPECGTFRRCKAKAKYPYNVCRMHGAGGGRPPLTGKFIPPAQIADAYNALIDDPALLSLAFNIAMSEARTYELLNMIGDNDMRAQAGDVSVMLNELLNSIFRAGAAMRDAEIEPKTILWMENTAREIIETLRPDVTAEKVWRQVNRQLEVTRRLNDTERKWIDQHDQMVPMSQVLESLSIIIRMALKYIESPQDRSAFAKEMRTLMPVTT